MRRSSLATEHRTVWALVAACGLGQLGYGCADGAEAGGPNGGTGTSGGDSAGAAGAGAAGAGGSTGTGGAGTTGGAGGTGTGASAGGSPDAGRPISFPIAVDSYFYPSGYIGDGAKPGAIVESKNCPRRAGDQLGDCHQFTWKPGSAGWASVFWQYPANNWTHLPGRPIPPGATQLTFYAWSDAGGESIGFGAGQAEADTFQISVPPVVLTATPTRYTIPLADIRYGGSVVGGFMWVASFAPAAGIRFYIDDIEWQNAPAQDPDDGWPAGPQASGISLRVRNKCAFPLWIDGSGKEAALSPAKARLASGGIQNYDAPKTWTAGRVNAYRAAADAEPIEKAEMTFYIGMGGTPRVGYNVTYVDWVGLPMEIHGSGGSCNIASHRTGCFASQATVASGCPESFLAVGGKCLSPRTYCSANSASAYCNALSSAISACPQCPGGTTTDVYACSGPYAQQPRWCAALNRGMANDADNPNRNLYYTKPPYNTYAKWVHQVCPGIYAFSYDDWLSQGGFRDCAGATEVRVTFCPDG